MKSKGYTLWFVPKGQNYKRFSGLIKKLAKEYGGPIFEPHVTLLGDVIISEKEAIAKTRQLVSGQNPFKVGLVKIDYEDYFFRTLFVRAKVSKLLQDLHNRAKEIFKVGTLPYMPHMSILYGNFPVEVKEKIIAEIGRNQKLQFDVSSVHLIKGGEVWDWKEVGEFPFKPS